VVRVKAELTAAIYDKALRRKDASGVVASKDDDDEKDDKKEKKSSADTGKIVNLMASEWAGFRCYSILLRSRLKRMADAAGDTNRIGSVVGGAYFVYGSPFEIVIASLFLYK